MMTRTQQQLLWYIGQFRSENDGVCPSYDEMKQFMGFASKSGIHRLVTALEERGHIRRLPHRARAIEVIKSPNDCCPTCGREI